MLRYNFDPYIVVEQIDFNLYFGQDVRNKTGAETHSLSSAV